MHIVFGFIGAVLSVLLVIYRVPVRRFIGPIAWAEEHLGSGGTYTVLLLVGIFAFFLSLMIMTDTLNLLFGGFFGLFRSV